MRGPLVPLLVLALLVPAAGVQAAATQHTHLDWREGRFLVGTSGAGESLFPESVDAPDHERLDVEVNPCHRDLEVDLLYRPAGATASVGDYVQAELPYRFRISLYAPNGTQLVRYVVDEPDHGYPLGEVAEPGNYTLQLELIEGFDVHWEVRVQGEHVRTHPTCALWLNEVETNPPGPDPGEEFVEIYTDTGEPFDLTGWSIRAATPNASHTYPIPQGTTVGVETDHTAVNLTGPPVADRNATVELVPPVGGELDNSPVIDDTQDDEATHQRSPDGALDWVFAEGTPGAPNVR